MIKRPPTSAIGLILLMALMVFVAAIVAAGAGADYDAGLGLLGFSALLAATGWFLVIRR